MADEQRQGFFERVIPLTMIGLAGLGIGVSGGIWYSRQYLSADVQPVAPVTVQPTRLPVSDSTGVASVRVAMAPAATVPANVRPVEATSLPALAQGSRTLYTCSRAKHLDATTQTPGTCPTCRAKLVPIERAPFGLQALVWYGRHGETRPQPTTRPKPISRPVTSRPVASRSVTSRSVTSRSVTSRATTQPTRTLYTCTSPKHLDATQPAPGVCGTCGTELVPVDRVPHGIRAIAHFAQQSEAKPPVTDTPAATLFTCPNIDHMASTTDQPGTCATCELVLLPVERVGHTARAIRYWTKRQPAGTASQRPDSKPAAPRLFTCPDLQHVDVTGLDAGRCPKCGLEMRPVNRVLDEHRKLALEAYRLKSASTR